MQVRWYFSNFQRRASNLLNRRSRRPPNATKRPGEILLPRPSLTTGTNSPRSCPPSLRQDLGRWGRGTVWPHHSIQSIHYGCHFWLLLRREPRSCGAEGLGAKFSRTAVCTVEARILVPLCSISETRGSCHGSVRIRYSMISCGGLIG